MCAQQTLTASAYRSSAAPTSLAASASTPSRPPHITYTVAPSSAPSSMASRVLAMANRRTAGSLAVNAPSLKTGRENRLVVAMGTRMPVSSSARRNRLRMPSRSVGDDPGGPRSSSWTSTQGVPVTEASAVREGLTGSGVPRLDARGLTKRFGRLTVLRDVSLRIGPGEVVALVGENGAGKSSLVACLTRILEPEEGEVRLDGAPLPSTPDQVRQGGVEVLWQDYGLCDDLDVVANVFLGREPGRWLIAESNMREGAASVLRQVGAETLPLDRPVPWPSPGQRPPVALGRALMSAPR